mgnify:CR=1 FL=1
MCRAPELSIYREIMKEKMRYDDTINEIIIGTIQMDIKRGKSLYMIFLGYLISFCILSIIWIFSLVAFINISVNKDIIKPANYMENQVEKLKLEAKQGLKFDSSKIPYSSNYIFFDNKKEQL